MSAWASASIMSAAVGNLRRSLSAEVYFWPGICWTSKSNNRIQAIHQGTGSPGESVPDQFHFATKTLASVSKTNLTLYNQYLTFFKTFKTLWLFCFIASYIFSALDQIPLSYLEGFFFLLTSYISTPSHSSKLASTTSIISSASSE